MTMAIPKLYQTSIHDGYIIDIPYVLEYFAIISRHKVDLFIANIRHKHNIYHNYEKNIDMLKMSAFKYKLVCM